MEELFCGCDNLLGFNYVELFVAVFMLLQTVILALGIKAIGVSRRTLASNAMADLTSQMNEINRIELEHPDLFPSLKVGRRRSASAVKTNDAQALLLRGNSVLDRQVGHYLFMLFSYYERLFLLNAHMEKSFHKSWERRFKEHMLLRPRFREYWEREYRKSCSYEFCYYVRIIRRMIVLEHGSHSLKCTLAGKPVSANKKAADAPMAALMHRKRIRERIYVFLFRRRRALSRIFGFIPGPRYWAMELGMLGNRKALGPRLFP